MKKLFIFLFCLFNVPVVQAASVTITLEHAMTSEQRALGLMGRKHLDSDQGMLFHFPFPQKVSFWMYGTFIDLSIAFLDENSFIIEIYEMQAYPEENDKAFFLNKMITSKSLIHYALEMNKNWFTRHSIKPGDRLLWKLNEPTGFIVEN